MVHEALQEWRDTNCRNNIGNPAIARFLTSVIASREGTPKDQRMNSPFSVASLSPLSPLVALTDTVLLESSVQQTEEDTVLLESAVADDEFAELVDGDIPCEIQEIDVNAEYRTSSSDDDTSTVADKVKDEEDFAELPPRRSTRTKTKRASNATSERTRRPRTVKRVNAPKTVKKKQTVDDVFEVLPLGESRKCSCKKSKCLKLYCECFAAGVLCDPGCKCTDCANTADNVAARRKAVAYKLSRKPKAFQEKIVETTAAKDGAVHSKGCNCKRSGCQKKYCECYQGGVACNDSCKCVNCKNDGSLMHLRDLGVAGWKAPDGGFKMSAHGVMSTMIVVPEGGFVEEPIPQRENEAALEKFLMEEHIKREALRGVNTTPKMEMDTSTPKSMTVWPVAKPVQVTPRSGTALEAYPNQKRRCQKKTPKSFSANKSEDIDGEEWLIELGGDESILAAVEEECGALSTGLEAGDSNEQTDVDTVEIDMHLERDLAAVDDLVFDKDVAQQTSDILLGSVQTPKPQDDEEDNMMREMEGAMADLLTPRFTELVTPRLVDLLSPRSCRSSATTRSSNMELDWDQHISTPRGDWDILSTTPRGIAAC